MDEKNISNVNNIDSTTQNFDKIISDLDKISGIAEIKNNPVIKSTIIPILKSVPIIGELIDNSIDSAINNFQAQKRAELISYIINTKILITSEMVNNIEFIMSFARTIEVIDRLAMNDKVKYFANLLKNSYLTKNKIPYDDYTEFFECLNKLSLRQINVLSILYKIELNPDPLINPKVSKDAYFPYKYWDAFESKLDNQLDIKHEDIPSIMKSLESSGLYSIASPVTYGAGSFNVQGELTPFFKRFAKIVLEM